MKLSIYLAIYLISFAYSWWWTRTAYSNKSRWSNLNPYISDVFYVVLPFVNTVYTIYSIFDSPYPKKERKPINYSKFFNLKNKK